MTDSLQALMRRYRPDRVATGPLPVVAYIGRDVPRELIRAAGATPYRLSGRPGFTAPADRFCGSTLDAVSRSQLSRILTGELAHCAGLVISGDCEGSVRCFLYLREIQRLEPFAGVPPFTFLDLLHLPQRTSALYNVIRLRQLAGQLGRWTGVEPTDDLLAPQIELAEQTRSLGARLQGLRGPARPRLTGSQALEVLGAGLTTDDDAHPVLLEQLLSELPAGREEPAEPPGPAETPVPEGVPVFLTGSSHDRPEAYQLIESRGAVIVGEDHDWGALSTDSPVDLVSDPFTDLARAYAQGAPAAAGSGIADRAAYTARQAGRSGARLVIAWLRAGDDAPAWDVGAQREALGALGIPMLVLAAQPYSMPTGNELSAVTDELDRSLAGVAAVAR